MLLAPIVIVPAPEHTDVPSDARMVEIANEGARDLGFANVGQMWLSKYDMPAAQMETEVERLWGQLQPFYEQLHCLVRARLNDRYGDAVVLSWRDAPQQLAIGEAQLHSVLFNLVDNALRHGAGQPVEVSLSDRQGRLSIAVRDRGPGISPANVPRLFQRFFTTERDRGGTGLGLAMVKAIAEARGGQVSVDTGPGGSTFTVVL